MQPYFFPYLGYFQLLNAVDEFIVYDNIEFSRRGWIHRNRILVNGKEEYISLPLKATSDYELVCNRYLADTWQVDKKKMLNRITESYRRSPYYKEVIELIIDSLNYPDTNLFNFLLHSIRSVCNYLQINTNIIISSSIPIDHKLKAEHKVLALCKARNANAYINPIGGVGLYNKDHFLQHNIQLFFLKMNDIQYKQFDHQFIPALSIIDVMMFNPGERIKEWLNHYSIT